MKVIRRFRDKETKKVYNVGQTYDGTEARAKEVAAKGFIELEEPKKETEQTTKGKKEEKQEKAQNKAKAKETKTKKASTKKEGK